MNAVSRKILIAGLVAATCMPAAVQAQEGPLVYNAKPEVTRTTCDPQAVYDLVPMSSATSYRTTSTTAPGGYDPTAPVATCGSVTRAIPLTCVTSTGARAPDQAACEPATRTSYERRNRTTVHRAPGAGLDYYTAETRTIGSVPLVTRLRITTDIVSTCLQIREVEAYSNGVNVALASSGATVSATPPYSNDYGGSGPQYVNDGTVNGMYHSTCSGGNYVDITFAQPSRIDRIAITGRPDEYGSRDVYGYQLFNGSTQVGTGQIDSRNKVGEASPGGSCDAQTFEWRTTPGQCVNGQAQNTVSCHDADTGAVVDASRCNASMRPAQTSVCTTQTSTPSIPEVRVGWCGYTSSGGGRYSCGPVEDGFVRTGQVASWPYPSELCTGKLIETDEMGTLAGKNWVNAPVTRPVPGARCVLHTKFGYSGHWERDRPTWIGYYYDGPPTGHPGGTYIRKKP